MTQRKQTVSFLRSRFDEVGISPQTRHGQNFLIDLNLLHLLFDTAEVESSDVVLEIGTGMGSLTSLLAASAAAVITVEIDSRLHQMASEELIDFDNVTMLLQDALKNKNTLDPRVLDAVRAKLAEGRGRRFKLVSNLPFSIATPIISNLLAADPTPETITVTIQKELADRIIAKPFTKDYGSLSVWTQSQCQAEIVRLIPPEAFWPRPKVTSAIVQLRLDDALRSRIADREFFHHFARGLFMHRRKFLRSVLPSAFKGQLEKTDIDAILERQSIPTTTRAEELSIETILQLSDAVQKRLADGAPKDR